MTWNGHPPSVELLEALHDPGSAAPVTAHLAECLACRVRYSRISQAAGIEPLGDDGLRRVIDASTPLPETMAHLVSAGFDEEPRANEIWRVGRGEALLVWVRQMFGDEVADIVPLVLDVELADDDSVLIENDATVLGTEIAAMVALRTHIHRGAFLNRIGTLDISRDVTEVMTAMREGRRASGIPAGPPVRDADDQRIEYRQVLRDLLAELSPSAWSDGSSAPEAEEEKRDGEAEQPLPSSELDPVISDLRERLPGVQCSASAERLTVELNSNLRVTTALKVIYLDTTVLSTTLDGSRDGRFPEASVLIAACRKLTRVDADADAVSISVVSGDWPTLLFTTAHLREAVGVPHGRLMDPIVTLQGYGLVDTLCKHLEDAVLSWDVTDSASAQLTGSLRGIAVKHARESLHRISQQGAKARQDTKRKAWTSLPEGFDLRVAEFVQSVAETQAVGDAVAELIAEATDD